jgi:hypothetical protein
MQERRGKGDGGGRERERERGEREWSSPIDRVFID